MTSFLFLFLWYLGLDSGPCIYSLKCSNTDQYPQLWCLILIFLYMTSHSSCGSRKGLLTGILSLEVFFPLIEFVGNLLSLPFLFYFLNIDSDNQV